MHILVKEYFRFLNRIRYICYPHALLCLIIPLTNPNRFAKLSTIATNLAVVAEMAKKNVFREAYLNDEAKAHEYLERLRWPNGPVCPHCGATKIYRLDVKSVKRRVLKCAACRKQFSVTVGTVFEDSHLPLTKWLAAYHLMCASKKGISALQLSRMLGVGYRAAWFMAHRIRYSMVDTSATGTGKLGGTVEVDETYVGGKRQGGPQAKMDNKTPVVSLVEREGRVRSFVMDHVTGKNLKTVIREQVHEQSKIMTDQHAGYQGIGKHFESHDTVDHSRKEWKRGEAHTNTVEGYFSLLKRGINGTFHHVSAHHLHRYLSEFDFRYNARKIDDNSRTVLAVRGIEGKRLQYN